MKYKISCYTWDEERNHRYWNSSQDGRLWPCANIVNAWVSPDESDNKLLREDPGLIKALREDPDFNNMSKKSVQDIMSHELFAKRMWFEGWEGNDCPAICIKNCGNKVED